MAEIVNTHEAKTHLSRLLERVRRGATITIAKAGEPVAMLVPVGHAPATRGVREPTTLPGGVAADRRARLTQLFEQEVWPDLPADQAGRRLRRDEEDAILGYGEAGT